MTTDGEGISHQGNYNSQMENEDSKVEVVELQTGTNSSFPLKVAFSKVPVNASAIQI